jgi:hypothetical protein
MTKKRMFVRSKSTLKTLLNVLGEEVSKLTHQFCDKAEGMIMRVNFSQQIEAGTVGKYADLCSRFAQAATMIGDIKKEDPDLSGFTRSVLLGQQKALDNIIENVFSVVQQPSTHDQLIRTVDAQLDTVRALTVRGL